MPAKPSDTENHRVARSRQNRVAGRILLRARQVSDMSQTEFAAALAKRLGLPSFGQPTLSGWETSIRAIPAAVLIAASEISRTNGFSLSETIDGELGPSTAPQAAKLAAALEAMADALKGEAADNVRAAAEALRPKRQR